MIAVAVVRCLAVLQTVLVAQFVAAMTGVEQTVMEPENHCLA